MHFWEYMQPGYDALGFISCTGTNFLMRANAFIDVSLLSLNSLEWQQSYRKKLMHLLPTLKDAHLPQNRQRDWAQNEGV